MSNKLIIATVGPSSMNKETIVKMDKSGVDIFRINLSHTDANEFQKIFNKLSNWTKKPICPDTEGAQLRTGKLSQNELTIEPNDIIELVGSNIEHNNFSIPLNILSPENIFNVGDLLKIDFDDVLVQICRIQEKSVKAKIIVGGVIRSNKGISVDRQIRLPSLTEKDFKVMKIANKLNIESIFLSFCSNGEGIRLLRSLFNYEISVIAKIESQKGLKNIDSICNNCDGILIDRGDLSRDVAIEKIAFAQSFVMKKGLSFKTPVYTATNFLESMIQKPRPTRAEINDIVSTLNQGGSGIVLAAETAIGRYPVESVRVISRIINEFDNIEYYLNQVSDDESIDYLLSLSMDGIIKPHGGTELVEQVIPYTDNIYNLPSLKINAKNISDVLQISEGTYTPVTGFMNIEEISSVLTKNKLLSGVNWTLPIILQVSKSDILKIPHAGKIVMKDSLNNEPVGLLDIRTIEKFNPNDFIKRWFGTDNKRHPGVQEMLNAGDYIVSGDTFLYKKYRQQTKTDLEFSPKQVREIFYHNGWNNVVGFHTRNIPHTGHEYIQKKALELSSVDAILLSPVSGVKKTGDFKTNVIINCYQTLIKKGVYDPKGVLLSAFNTYSRYAGPREAIFTAICRKNFGCNNFIIGRDHTGVDNFYSSKASQEIFDKINLEMEILFFDTASYCTKRKMVTTNFDDLLYDESRLEISATSIRDHIRNEGKIPDYLIHPELSNFLIDMYKSNSQSVFYD